jgi:hypothetical protein
MQLSFSFSAQQPMSKPQPTLQALAPFNDDSQNTWHAPSVCNESHTPPNSSHGKLTVSCGQMAGMVSRYCTPAIGTFRQRQKQL